MKTDTLTICDCGHPATPSGCAAGYATTPAGKTLCYACADANQREQLKDRSKPFVAYVSGDLSAITSWSGGQLMRITGTRACQLTRQSFTHDRHSYKTIWATDCHGGKWYGRGSAGIAITLRPCKN